LNESGSERRLPPEKTSSRKIIPRPKRSRLLEELFDEGEAKVQQRIKQQNRQRKKVIAAIKHFIRTTQTQISLVTLLRETKMNTWRHIMQFLTTKNFKQKLPASTHFYVTKDA
jgi:hypothetical protein